MTSVERNYDHLLKIFIVGGTAGKTSLMKRSVGESFSYNEISTIGVSPIFVNFKSPIVDIDGERVKLQLLDTAAQEIFRTIINPLYKETHGVILVYDITDVRTFDNLSW